MSPIQIAQISDLHFTKISFNPFRLFPKRIFGMANWLCQRRSPYFSQQLTQLTSLLNSLPLDQILFCGDFTTTSLHSEFQSAKRFTQKLKAPFLSIPGNHDHYTYTSFRNKHFYQYFKNQKPIQKTIDFFNLQDHGIEAHAIHNQWTLIALDTARPTMPGSAKGFFSQKLETYLKEILGLIPQDQSILIMNHYPFFQNEDPNRILERGEKLQSILQADRRIRMYLHGHTHRHILADLQQSHLPLILDSGSVFDNHFPTWNLLKIDEAGITIDVYSWKNGWRVKENEQRIQKT